MTYSLIETSFSLSLSFFTSYSFLPMFYFPFICYFRPLFLISLHFLSFFLSSPLFPTPITLERFWRLSATFTRQNFFVREASPDNRALHLTRRHLTNHAFALKIDNPFDNFAVKSAEPVARSHSITFRLEKMAPVRSDWWMRLVEVVISPCFNLHHSFAFLLTCSRGWVFFTRFWSLRRKRLSHISRIWSVKSLYVFYR